MILDTNALLAASDNHPAIVAPLLTAEELALPVIVLGEYRYGISQSRHQARYEQWLDELIADCTVLDINEETSHHYAAIHLELRKSGKPIPTNDFWIAALSRQHTLSLLSCDRHFDFVRGIRRIEW